MSFSKESVVSYLMYLFVSTLIDVIGLFACLSNVQNCYIIRIAIVYGERILFMEQDARR